MSRPDPTAQHRPLVLTVSGGMNGYRLAFAGGEYWSPLTALTLEDREQSFPTWDDAVAAYTEILRLSSRAVKAA